jgi:hypothetical protein
VLLLPVGVAAVLAALGLVVLELARGRLVVRRAVRACLPDDGGARQMTALRRVRHVVGERPSDGPPRVSSPSSPAPCCRGPGHRRGFEPGAARQPRPRLPADGVMVLSGVGVLRRRRRRRKDLEASALSRGMRLLPRTLPYLRPYRGKAALSVVLTVAAAAATLAEPVPFAFIIDTVLAQREPPGWLTAIVGDGSGTLIAVAVLASLVLTLATVASRCSTSTSRRASTSAWCWTSAATCSGTCRGCR